jgi:hypothetical protein
MRIPMTDIPNLIIHEEFVAPGVLRVSAEALKYARDFIESVTAAHGDGHIAVFDWSTKVEYRTDPQAPLQTVYDCLGLGASSRSEIPPDAVQTVDGLDFAIELPLDVLQKSVQRLIDVDENAFFRLVLK